MHTASCLAQALDGAQKKPSVFMRQISDDLTAPKDLHRSPVSRFGLARSKSIASHDPIFGVDQDMWTFSKYWE